MNFDPNYYNQITEVKIEARTIILVKNFTCIKNNDIVFEAAPISKDKTISQKEIKYIIAQKSGELVLENNGHLDSQNNLDFKTRTIRNYIFWVLSGQVFTIPQGSKIKVRKFQKSFKNQALSETKVNATISGFIHLTMNNTDITAIKVQKFFQSLNRYKFFIEKNFSGFHGETLAPFFCARDERKKNIFRLNIFSGPVIFLIYKS